MAAGTIDSATRNGDLARSGLNADALRRGVLDNLTCLQARPPAIATPHDWYMALAYSVRDRMLARWEATIQTYAARELRVACYLSAEFLIGPQLGNNLVNLGIEARPGALDSHVGSEYGALREIFFGSRDKRVLRAHLEDLSRENRP
jgi:starch phosphorylase